MPEQAESHPAGVGRQSPADSARGAAPPQQQRGTHRVCHSDTAARVFLPVCLFASPSRNYYLSRRRILCRVPAIRGLPPDRTSYIGLLHANYLSAVSRRRNAVDHRCPGSLATDLFTAIAPPWFSLPYRSAVNGAAFACWDGRLGHVTARLQPVRAAQVSGAAWHYSHVTTRGGSLASLVTWCRRWPAAAVGASIKEKSQVANGMLVISK